MMNNNHSGTHVVPTGARLACRRHRVMLFALVLAASPQAFAIPSPDLVINLSASVAQLLGLVSVLFGGAALSARSKARRKRARGAAGNNRLHRILLAVTALALLGSVTINTLQYTRSLDATNQRLHVNLVRKSVENGEAVGDTSLKTLSFSDQLDHERGISTDELAALLDSDEPLYMIDVREDEEVESGVIDGAIHLRYPDVLANSSLIPENANTLFLCYSGNRSSELCSAFTDQGRSCNFMVGGMEKWLTESRPLGGKSERSLDELRELPDYPNRDVLLDTPDVHRLVNQEKARFVDVRYPAEFVKGHLPGATNITMRALPTATLDERINALPDDRPLITACYDKRSCFYSTVMGLRMSRAGKDVRGRYTVPHEYYLPKGSERSHVAVFRQSQEQRTLGGMVSTPLRHWLNYVTERSGHYGWALLLTVLLIRLAMLPLALKAERDTQVQKSLAGRLATLKDELSEHPRALSEATLALYRQYRIRPVVNMLSSLLQLSFLLLFYSAVSGAATGWQHTLGWIPQAATADPWYLLPAVVAVLFVALVVQSGIATSRRRQAFLALGGLAMLWLLSALGAAVNLYLTISLSLLVLQGAGLRLLGQRLGWARAGHDKLDSIDDTGLVPLAQAHWLPQATGKKAARLGQLIEAGFRVPDGFVFTSSITNRARVEQALGGESRSLLDATQVKMLDRLWRKLKADKVAVRSSGANEDGVANSFAGVYESILNVGRDELISAVREVYASLSSERSDAYNRQGDTDDTFEPVVDEGGVVVQKMVPAEHAGVLFTEHPATTGAMLLEMVEGLGEELVSGTVTPNSYAYGRASGQMIVEASSVSTAAPVDIGPLLETGRQIEALFGTPQDIEWAYARGRFYILQARDITRSVASGNTLRNLAERERGRLLTQAIDSVPVARATRPWHRNKETVAFAEPVFVQNELSELLPRPTPLSLGLMQRLWDAGGSTDLACQELGIPYAVNYNSVPYLSSAFGWAYVNKLEEQRRLGRGPGAIAAFSLARNAERLEQAFVEDFLPGFQQEMIERRAIVFDRLGKRDALVLLESWVERFVEETYRQAELINIAADYYTKTALAKLTAAGLEPLSHLGHAEETEVSACMALLAHQPIQRSDVEAFLERCGHRAPLDYELSLPRFAEDMPTVRQYIERLQKSVPVPQKDPEHGPVPELPASRMLRISVARARRFQSLKEDAKHWCLQELAQIRQLLLQLDTCFDLSGDIFQLQIEEVLQLGDALQVATLRRSAEARRDAAQTWKAQQLPATLSIEDLERIDMQTGQRAQRPSTGELSGKRVAGDREVAGTVRVITDVAQIDEFRQGEILVARMTDPTWYTLFSQARGIVTEVGGWLSHAAIVAREFDLPAIVGVSGVCQRLHTGDVIRLGLDGTIEVLEERRSEDSPMRNVAPLAADALAEAEARGRAIGYAEGLANARVIQLQRRLERRAMKHSATDRRNEARLAPDNQPQTDRRAINRAAYAFAPRGAPGRKAS